MTEARRHPAFVAALLATSLMAVPVPSDAGNPALETLIAPPVSAPVPDEAPSSDDAAPAASQPSGTPPGAATGPAAATALPSFPVAHVPLPPIVSPTRPVSAPMDIVPHDVPAFVDVTRLKLVNVPLPPPSHRAPAAMAMQAPAAAPNAGAAADAGPDVPIGAPSAASFGPRISEVPSSVLEPSLNPAIPPAPGSAALPTVTLPPEARPPSDEEEEGAHSGGSVETQTDIVDVACLKPQLLDIVKKTGEFFHQIPVITSGYRAYGRPGSYHRLCMAADFIVPGVSQEQIVKYLHHVPGVGGVGTYCGTKIVHVDIGEPRDWAYCGLRRTFFSLR